MKVCSVADVHANHARKLDMILPEADVLTISGDLTMSGSIDDLYSFRDWLDMQPHKYKIMIAGNHDFCFERKSTRQEAEVVVGGPNRHYLMDESVTIDGITFYGSPWQPWFHDWAFNVRRGNLHEKWQAIPQNVDVLLVHGPPTGYGDKTVSGDHAGCDELLAEIKLKKPRISLYGHIHEDTGIWSPSFGEYTPVLVNCSIGYRIGRTDSRPREAFLFDITKDSLSF